MSVDHFDIPFSIVADGVADDIELIIREFFAEFRKCINKNNKILL